MLCVVSVVTSMIIGIDIGMHDRYYTSHVFIVSKEQKKDTKLLMQNVTHLVLL
jgi:hypothetical protein